MTKRDSTASLTGSAVTQRRGGGWPRRSIQLVAACISAAAAVACGDSDSPTKQTVAATVVVSPSELTLEAGKTGSLQAAVAGADGAAITGARVSWSTTSAAIASVAQTGAVTGVASGVARVTAAAGTVSGSGIVAVTPAAVTQPVGAGGATVSTPGGEVRVTLPNGTLPNGGSVTITPVTTGTTAGTTVPGTVYKIGVFGISIGPRPTITVRYSVAGLPPGFDEQKLTLSRKVGVFWIPLPSVVDVLAKTITATLPSANIATASLAAAFSATAADEESVVGAALFSFEPSAASVQLTVGERRRITGRVVALGSGGAVALSDPTATSSAGGVAAPAAPATVTGTEVGVDILGVAAGSATITLGASVAASGGAAPFASNIAVTVVQQASLAVTIAGLPAGVNAAVTVTGPGGFTQALTASQTLTIATAGSYTVSAQSVSSAGQTYNPTPSTQTVTVNAGDSKAATVTYASTTGSLAVTISGLPNGVAGGVNVAGPGGFTRALTSTTTITGLTAGQYTVSATSVNNAGVSYFPNPATQSVGVSVGQTATAAVSYAVPAACATVTVQPSSISVSIGTSVQPVVTLKDASGNTLTGRTVSFSTSNAAIFVVNASGVVTGVANGTATLTVACDPASTQVQVTVAPPPVASITVTPSSFAAFIGDTVPLTARTFDAAGNTLVGRAITWSSNNPTAATVSSSGRVAGLAPGSVTITVTSEGKSTSSNGVFGCFSGGLQVACGTLNIGIQTPGSPITGVRTVVNGYGHLRCLFSITFVPTGGDAGTWTNDTPNWTWATLAIRSGTNIPATVDYFQDWKNADGSPGYPPFAITITWRYRINSSGVARSVTMGPLTCQ